MTHFMPKQVTLWVTKIDHEKSKWIWTKGGDDKAIYKSQMATSLSCYV